MKTSSARQPGLGKRIREIRLARGITQRELGRRSGLAVPFISRVENDRTEPSVRTLERVALALDVALGDLIEAPATGVRSVCPVSRSGRCIAETILRPGPRTPIAGEQYTPRQIQLLRLSNYLVQRGSPEVLASLETIMRAMVRLPGVRRDRRWLRAIGRAPRVEEGAVAVGTPPAGETR